MTQIPTKVIFDMETGDPDDLMTLLFLLINPEVNLLGVTCYQGSPIQIGMIEHVLQLAQKDIPIGGSNCKEPQEISPYYADVIGKWKPQNAKMSAKKVLKNILQDHPDTCVLTGAPLTNLKDFINSFPKMKIKKMVTQGGYIGNLVAPDKKLAKFKGKPAYRTYNLGQDVEAFKVVNECKNIENLTYVTKDLCHGFVYTPEIHQTINFSSQPLNQLLKKCLSKYGDKDKDKALHDPLAMLMMLYPELGKKKPVKMNYKVDERGHPVFSSIEMQQQTVNAVIDYDREKAWSQLIGLCEYNPQTQLKKVFNYD